MLLGLLAVTCITQFDPGVFDEPCASEGKGIALIFAEKPSDGFELFVKPAGQNWHDNAALRKAAMLSVGSPFIVFHLGRMDMDYSVKLVSTLDDAPRLENTSTDFAPYFGNGFDKNLVLNNFGLHDIY